MPLLLPGTEGHRAVAGSLLTVDVVDQTYLFPVLVLLLLGATAALRRGSPRVGKEGGHPHAPYTEQEM